MQADTHSPPIIDAIDKSIINAYQDGFPLVSQPYKLIADEFDITEDDVIQRLKQLKESKIISRIGAIITPNTIGVSTLCALAVPVDKLEETARIINSFTEVNHNYQRSHEFNLWFVLAAQNERHLNKTLTMISSQTGMPVINLPLQTAYYLNLGFSID